MKSFEEVNIEIRANIIIPKGSDKKVANFIKERVEHFLEANYPTEDVSCAIWGDQ